MSDPIVKVENLYKRFGNLEVLKGINLRVAPREVVCLIGRSGSGKSTLLRCINFLEEPNQGVITVAGISVPAGERTSAHRQQIIDLRERTGMVFQSFNLFPHKTVLENLIEAPMIVKRMSREQVVPIAGVGFALMFITGALLFWAEAVTAYDSVHFWIKLGLILMAGLNALYFERVTHRGIAEWDSLPVPPLKARMAGFASLILWTAVIITGRTMAYSF